MKVTIVKENVLYSYLMKSNLTFLLPNALTSAFASSRICTAAVLNSAARWRAVCWVENVICDAECRYILYSDLMRFKFENKFQIWETYSKSNNMLKNFEITERFG